MSSHEAHETTPNIANYENTVNVLFFVRPHESMILYCFDEKRNETEKVV